MSDPFAALHHRHRRVLDHQIDGALQGGDYTGYHRHGPGGLLTTHRLDALAAALRPEPSEPSTYCGIRILQSEHAVTNRRDVTWFDDPPPSRNRSRRVWKKLRKRTARQEIIADPAIISTPQGMVVHPSVYAQLRAMQAKNARYLYD